MVENKTHIKTRIRDFIKTDIGYFAVNTYEHPKDRVIAFLRYLNLEKIDNIPNFLKKYNLENEVDIRNNKYLKIVNTSKTFKILKELFPEYIFYDEKKEIYLHGVPNENIIEILTPKNRLNEMLEKDKKELTNYEKKCVNLANKLNEYGLNYNCMGISGSTVVKLNNINSDIDFVIYGMNNHNKARNILKELFNENNDNKNNKKDNKTNKNNKDNNNYEIKPLSDDFWKKAYTKRIKDNTLSYEEFVFYEKRKYNRGQINNTMFDLLATRSWNEINNNYEECQYKNIGTIKITGIVHNNTYFLDNPALYYIKCNEILNLNLNEKYKSEKNNINIENIKEIVSYTHTYAGQVFKNEEIVANGKLEKVIKKDEIYYRILIGTTRESLGEYVKLKNKINLN